MKTLHEVMSLEATSRAESLSSEVHHYNSLMAKLQVRATARRAEKFVEIPEGSMPKATFRTSCWAIAILETRQSID